MQIITNMDFQLNHTAVCIGKFDGIHKGHRMLIEEAEKTGLTMVMFTFVFSSAETIYSFEEKIKLAEELGIDVLIACKVTDAFMHMTAAQFIEDILVKRCDAKKVVVGSDFCFGYERAGTVDDLRTAGEKYGFSLTVFEKLKHDGEVIGSTRIRRELAKGNMKTVNELLDNPYFFYGNVEQGNQIGRKMSIPTANIRPDKRKVLPPYGVYATVVSFKGKNYASISNLGVKPTIPGQNDVGLEVWLFDFDGNLYDQKITVSLIEFQRPEKKFDSVEELKKQIEQDTNHAKEILFQLKDEFPLQFASDLDFQNPKEK